MTAAETGNRSELASVGRGGVANLIGAVISAIANFGLVILVARAVPPTTAGIFFAVTSGFLVVETAIKLGADVSIVYFIARWCATDSADRIRRGMRIACAPPVLLSLVLSAVMIGGAAQIARLIGDKHAASTTLVRVLAIALPFAVFYDIALSATRGFSAMRPTVLIEKIGRPVAQVALIALVLAVGWHGAIGYAWVLPYVGGCGAAWLALRAIRRYREPSSSTKWTWDRQIASDFWSFSIPRALAGVAQIVLQRLDIVLVAVMRGAADAAIYTAATRFLVVFQFVNQAISAPLQPRLSAAMSIGATRRTRGLYRATTAWTVLATWPLCGLSIVFADRYVRTFGSGYASGTHVVIILSLAMLAASACGPVDNVIIMAGKSSWNLSTTMIALAVNVAVDVALIPHFGLTGAAIGWFSAILASNLAPLAISWRKLDLHPFGKGTLIACALSFVAFFVFPFLGRSVLGGDEGALIGSLVGSGGFALGLVGCRRALDLAGTPTLRADSGRAIVS